VAEYRRGRIFGRNGSCREVQGSGEVQKARGTQTHQDEAVIRQKTDPQNKTHRTHGLRPGGAADPSLVVVDSRVIMPRDTKDDPKVSKESKAADEETQKFVKQHEAELEMLENFKVRSHIAHTTLHV